MQPVHVRRRSGGTMPSMTSKSLPIAGAPLNVNVRDGCRCDGTKRTARVIADVSKVDLRGTC